MSNRFLSRSDLLNLAVCFNARLVKKYARGASATADEHAKFKPSLRDKEKIIFSYLSIVEVKRPEKHAGGDRQM